MGLLLKILAYYNAVLIPIFVLGVALFLAYKWSLLGWLGIGIAASSPLIAYFVVAALYRAGVIRLGSRR